MDTQCPSCRKPVDAEATVISVDGTIAVSRCGNCGFTLSESANHPGLTDHQDDRDPGPTHTPFSPQSDATVIGELPQDEGTQVAHFELIRVLGQGGFGAVWLARDTNLNREVALKLPKDPDVRLLHEAQTAARLKHPNIVSIFEVGVEDERAYIASEYIDGETLKDELLRGRPTIERTVQVMMSIAHAADHAHTQDVVHRDMKPANVMVDKSGRPYITDFGIAKSVSDDETISLDGEIVGTIAYMAPEQASGQNSATDRRADVYAMGVMLFELLTEYRPFRGSAQGILFQKGDEDAPSPRTLIPSLPKDLETICLKCLERDPDKRYQTARQLADELGRFKDNIPIQARPVSQLEKIWRWCLRNRALATGSAAFLVLLITFSVIGWYLRDQAVDSNERTSQTLYRTRMTLASDAWGTGNIELLTSLLRAYSGTDYERFRDFAWYYHDHVRAPFGLSVNHGSAVTDLAISRDGSFLATVGTKDKTLRVWDARRGQLLRDIRSDFQSSMVCFSPTDDRLLTVDDDGEIRVWNPAENDRVAFQLTHGRGLMSARFSPDRRMIVSAGTDGMVKFWNVSEREVERELATDENPVIDLRFSPDSSLLAIILAAGSRPASLAQTHIRILDVRSGETRADCEVRRRLSRLEFTSDNSEVVAASESGFVYRFDSVSGAEVEAVAPRAGTGVGDIVRIGASSRMAVCNGLGHMLILNELMKETHKLWTHINSFGVLDASADGKTIVVGSGDGSVRLISTEHLNIPVIGWQNGIVRDVEFCNDDNNVAVACNDGGVRLWDIADGKFQTIIPADEGERPMLSVALNPIDGTVSACGMMRHLQIASPVRSTEVESLALPPGGHSCVEYSNDGSLFAIGSRGGLVSVYSGSLSGDPMMTFSTEGRVTDLCFSPNSKLLAATFGDNQLLVVNPTTEESREVELPENDEPLSVTFCGSDSLLVVGTQQGFLRFITLDNSALQHHLKAHAGRVNDLAMFPDGQRLVSAGHDKVLRIWDIESREVVTHLQGHERGVLSVDVSRDGRTLASSGVEGDLRIWMSE